jgi:choline dehydrogenase-like flavoprotein
VVEPIEGLDADVIVVGGGLGGSAAAFQLAQRGLSVLVIEAGPGEDVLTPPRPTRREQVMRRLLPGRVPPAAPDRTRYPYFVAGPDGGLRPAPTRMGQGVGGSSQFYAAALSRFKRSDFKEAAPGRSAETPLPNAWPVDYDAFRTYYAHAESLMRIRGDADPLDPDDSLTPGAPLPALAPGSVRLHERLAQRGLHPYRLHVGIDYVPGCGECFAGRCPRACKADGNNRFLVPALATGRVRLEVDTPVREITVDDDGVRVVVVGPGGPGGPREPGERRARRLVLAAGALRTPLLLDRSDGLWRDVPRPAMLGRGLMFHLTDTWAAKVPDGATLPKKWLCVRDFYDDGVHDVGEIQSLGGALSPGPIAGILRARLAHTPLRRLPATALKPLAWVIARILGPRPIFATITEDLPHAHNRVREQDGKVVVDYAVDPELRRRTTAFRDTVHATFGPGVLFTSPPGNPNWGHPMGTCRMGDDAATSVVGADGRVHGQARVFVADASAFPSSGGTGPGLTVAALGLHVADQVADGLLG